MTKDEILTPLSRLHQDELMSCLIIKKGVQKNADILLLTDFTNSFWKDELQQHIEQEEQVLIPFLVKHRFEDRFIRIMKTDNLIIQSIFERLNTFDRRHKVFEIFANLVEQHIRFKERIVFEKVQELFSEKELEELGSKLNKIRNKKCTEYPVKFWE